MKPAALAPQHAHPRNLRQILVSPFALLASFWDMLPFTGQRMDEVRRLNEASDEDLAAKGLTRSDEVARIFGDPR